MLYNNVKLLLKKKAKQATIDQVIGLIYVGFVEWWW